MNAGKYPHLCRCLLIPCHAGKYLHGTSGYLPIFNTLCIYIPQPQVFTLDKRYLPLNHRGIYTSFSNRGNYPCPTKVNTPIQYVGVFTPLKTTAGIYPCLAEVFTPYSILNPRILGEVFRVVFKAEI